MNFGNCGLFINSKYIIFIHAWLQAQLVLFCVLAKYLSMVSNYDVIGVSQHAFNDMGENGCLYTCTPLCMVYICIVSLL